MGEITNRLQSVRTRIHNAEELAGRPNGSVLLLAVSKTRPAEELICAYWRGQRHFGENYLQEALVKQRALANFQITWHFIGPVQSNKTRQIATFFSWVHTIDRLKIAKRLGDQRPSHLPPLNVCIQVNTDHEETKSGVPIDQVHEMVAAISRIPGLSVRGLMAIPRLRSEFEAQRRQFKLLRDLMKELAVFRLDTLSMGMSGDLEAAIHENATIVRIGTALFGSRKY